MVQSISANVSCAISKHVGEICIREPKAQEKQPLCCHAPDEVLKKIVISIKSSIACFREGHVLDRVVVFPVQMDSMFRKIRIVHVTKEACHCSLIRRCDSSTL